MRKPWTLLLVGLVLGAALPVLARAPEALSIIINGHPVSGKALWYKEKIYVPLEDVAASTGGTYQYDERTGTARVTVGGGAARPGTPRVQQSSLDERPYIRVVWERKYVTGDNARVVTTLKNVGEATAQNFEAICIFKDDTLNELTAITRPIGSLGPGESRTVEFAMYDTSGVAGYPAYGYGTGGYYYPTGSVAGVGRGDKVLVDGHWTRIYYELKFNYQ